jgi:ornithine decarboxylase
MTAWTLRSTETFGLARKQRAEGLTSWPYHADAVQVACDSRPELPVLCFSPEQLTRNAEAFLTKFPGEVSYAVKANAAEDVVRTIAEAGVQVFDVASTVEMATVSAICATPVFHYHNPVKSRVEIYTAFNSYGCQRFAADCQQEIDKIAEVTGGADGIEIAVRFRLPAHGASAHDFSTKFGATVPEAVDLLKYASARGFCCVLTFHPGSQCGDPAAWRRHIEAAGDIARRAGVELRSLNVGGGFPARYASEQVPELDAFFAEISDAVTQAFGEPGAPRLECEPGRGMVANSQSVLTRVKLVKAERGEVFVNDGIYGALMEISQTPEIVGPHRAIRIDGDFSDEWNTWIIYGPTCDPLDMLPVKLSLPADIAEGDFIEFGTVGAYGTATATGFNGYGQFAQACVRKVLSI